MRPGFDFVVERTQFLDARPDRRAADVKLLREFRARNTVGILAQRGKDFGVSGHNFSAIDETRQIFHISKRFNQIATFDY
jgi:hypothetical protein